MKEEKEGNYFLAVATQTHTTSAITQNKDPFNDRFQKLGSELKRHLNPPGNTNGKSQICYSPKHQIRMRHLFMKTVATK